MDDLKAKCLVCLGSGWLCDEHTTLPWEHDDCDGVGVACRCNPQAGIAFAQVFVDYDRQDETQY